MLQRHKWGGGDLLVLVGNTSPFCNIVPFEYYEEKIDKWLVCAKIEPL